MPTLFRAANEQAAIPAIRSKGPWEVEPGALQGREGSRPVKVFADLIHDQQGAQGVGVENVEDRAFWIDAEVIQILRQDIAADPPVQDLSQKTEPEQPGALNQGR
jgi:hypothetical protein